MRCIVIILLCCLVCSCAPQKPTLEQVRQEYDDQQRWDKFEWELLLLYEGRRSLDE